MITTVAACVPLCPVCPACRASLPFAGCPHCTITGAPCVEAPRPARFASSVERTIAEAVMQYPSLYGRTAYARLYILDHLFATLGNGYAWRDGRLVASGPQISLHWQMPAEYIAWLDKRQERDSVNPAARVLRVAHRWATEHTHIPYALYPIFEDCALLDMPSDVRPDWLHAAWDAYALIMGVGHNSYDEDAAEPRTTASNRLAGPRLLAHLRAVSGPSRAAWHEARIVPIIADIDGQTPSTPPDAWCR